MTTENPNAFAFNSNRTHHKSPPQRSITPTSQNRANQLNPSWAQDQLTRLIERSLAITTSREQNNATLVSILGREDSSLRFEPNIRHAFVSLRRSHVEPALIEAVCAKLGDLDEATTQHLATHQCHQALLDLLHIAEEELADYITSTPPYRHRLVDREYPEQTRLFVYIDVSGDMDVLIDAYDRISSRKFPTKDRFESVHVSMVFVG